MGGYVFSLKPELFFHMKQNPDLFLHEKYVILQKNLEDDFTLKLLSVHQRYIQSNLY
jgi:hypothetical protein